MIPIKAIFACCLILAVGACRRRVPLSGRQAPRLLHVFGMHAHDRADLLAFRGHAPGLFNADQIALSSRI